MYVLYMYKSLLCWCSGKASDSISGVSGFHGEHQELFFLSKIFYPHCLKEWIVRLVQEMYASAWSHVHIGDGYSIVKVSVHQGLVLSLLLFITVLEALSREFHSGVPWEDLYADDLVIIAESLSRMCQEALDLERSNGGERTESKCRKDEDHDLWYGPGPLAEFRRVSMCCLLHWRGQQQHLCNGSKYWVHKKCSGLKRLTKDPDYICTWCQGTSRPLDDRPQLKGSPSRTWRWRW